MKAFAVIDSAWGDCGKGAAVDKIASLCADAVVIRHGGGSQCGHTVKAPDGRRHVFSSFGSGTFVGCPTYLGKEFVLNTKCFVNELHELSNKHVAPQVWVHPDCLVTTPLDVIINRELEKRRDKSRHGSVGIGFGETIERSVRGYPLKVRDLYHEFNLLGKIYQIHYQWYVKRCEELELQAIKGQELWKILDEFYEEIEEFLDNAGIMPEIPKYEVYIFEGNQGLLLDQKRGLEFPYLTRSNTGLQNVIPMCSEIGISKLKVVYMNRPYLTRHGAGPLPGEELWVSEKDNFNIIDETNVNGEWQGTPRYAPMNKTLLVNAISEDIKDAGNDVKIDYYSGYSCLDQVVNLGSTCDIGIETALYGFGPSRDKYDVENKFIRG